MNITLEQLRDYVKSAVDAGIQAYIRSVEPLSDRINQSDAKRWIAAMGHKPVMLSRWVDAGLLTRQKDADAPQNAQAWYSKAEIKNLLAAIELKMICNDQ